MPLPPAPRLSVSAGDRKDLVALSRLRSMPRGILLRLNTGEGTVIGECRPRHRHQEFLLFLERIDESIDPRLDVHLVLDNYGTHKHPEVRRWLTERPRYHVHFTPTG